MSLLDPSKNKLKLTNLIDEKKKNGGYKPDSLERIKEVFTQIYWPSKQSFIIVLFIIGILFVISHCLPSPFWLFFLTSDGSDGSNHYQNLIAIYAGISALIFALIIFIAESSRDHGDKVRVLLKVSFLYPLVVATILGYFNFLWGNINFWSIIVVILIGISVIFSIYRLISVLLNKSKFFKNYLFLLKDRFNQGIQLAIDARIGNNILSNKLGEMAIDYGYPTKGPEYYNFYSEKGGLVKEIDINGLKSFAEILETESKENGYSYYENDFKSLGNLETDFNTPSFGDLEKYKVNKHRYLRKKYKDKIKKGDPLVTIDKTLVTKKEIYKELGERVQNIFTIKDEIDFSEQIRLELSEIQDQFINSIKNENLGKIDEYFKIYSELGELFITKLSEYGVKYAFRKIAHDFEWWDELEWLKGDIEGIFSVGMKSTNKNVINKLGYLPINIAQKAIEFGNPYVFQSFISFSIELLNASYKQRDAELKSLMVDKSWRYMNETLDLVLIKIEQGVIEIEDLQEYANFILDIFYKLLRIALNNNDADSIELFQNAIDRVIDSLKFFEEMND